MQSPKNPVRLRKEPLLPVPYGKLIQRFLAKKRPICSACDVLPFLKVLRALTTFFAKSCKSGMFMSIIRAGPIFAALASSSSPVTLSGGTSDACGSALILACGNISGAGMGLLLCLFPGHSHLIPLPPWLVLASIFGYYRGYHSHCPVHLSLVPVLFRWVGKLGTVENRCLQCCLAPSTTAPRSPMVTHDTRVQFPAREPILGFGFFNDGV